MSSLSEAQEETLREESGSRVVVNETGAGRVSVNAPMPLKFRWMSDRGSLDAAGMHAELYGGRPSWEMAEEENARLQEEQRVSEESMPAGISEEELKTAVDAAHAEGFAQGEEEGFSKGRNEMEAAVELAVSGEREQVRDAIDEFRREEERYFAAVEVEVVKLALAIAARILHREVQLDPLLLRSAVRVALEKLEGQGSAALHVPEASVDAWKQVFGSDTRVDVVGDPALSAGQCVLNTKVGKVELGVVEQLEEIERGFFDLLSHRPRVESIE